MASPNMPRVTYSNAGVDFTPVHEYLDELIPNFEKNILGKKWETLFGTGDVENIKSPVDPAIEVGSFQFSTKTDVKSAIDSARKGFELWKDTTVEERLEFAARWREVLEEEKYNFALAALFEVGKSRVEALGEAEEIVDMVDYFPEEMKKNHGFRWPMNQLVKSESTLSVLKPYGVFAVIAPFNFPIALAVGPIVCALISGNSIVYKPSDNCCLTGLLLADSLKKAGIPDNVFNIVLGGSEVGEALTKDSGVDGVAFTGSHNTGIRIFRYMANQPWMKPVIAEMGGKNPAYVTNKADINCAAKGVMNSAFGLQGQKCSACSVVYVEKSIKERFINRLVEYTKELKVGDPRNKNTFMGPLYNGVTVERFEKSIEKAKKEGIIHFGGEPLPGKPSNYFIPAIVELPSGSELTKEELFMPFLVIREIESLKDGLEEGNDISYGLSAGIYSQDDDEINYFLDNAQAGVLYANRASGATTGAWPGAQPFCGWKGTGVSGKGGLGPHYLPQFMHEQSHTIMKK